jgi:hypothetical protein
MCVRCQPCQCNCNRALCVAVASAITVMPCVLLLPPADIITILLSHSTQTSQPTSHTTPPQPVSTADALTCTAA